MIQPGDKYEYNIRLKEALTTNIPNEDRLQFMTDFFNELGQNGEVVVKVEEAHRSSRITAAGTNGFIPYYVIRAVTVKAAQPAVKESA